MQTDSPREQAMGIALEHYGRNKRCISRLSDIGHRLTGDPTEYRGTEKVKLRSEEIIAKYPFFGIGSYYTTSWGIYVPATVSAGTPTYIIRVSIGDLEKRIKEGNTPAIRNAVRNTLKQLHPTGEPDHCTYLRDSPIGAHLQKYLPSAIFQNCLYSVIKDTGKPRNGLEPSSWPDIISKKELNAAYLEMHPFLKRMVDSSGDISQAIFNVIFFGLISLGVGYTAYWYEWKSSHHTGQIVEVREAKPGLLLGSDAEIILEKSQKKGKPKRIPLPIINRWFDGQSDADVLQTLKNARQLKGRSVKVTTRGSMGQLTVVNIEDITQ